MAQKRFIIGLTGNIATGKSTVLTYLATKGAHIIDADQLTHLAMVPGGPAYQPIVDEFGPTILNADGSVNRQALGKIVFSDPSALQRLEQIVHPAVFNLAQQEIETTSASIIVIEAIKLLEARRLLTLCAEVWVVTASLETQLQRLIKQRGMVEAEARRRMSAQSPQAEKVKQANRVIDNDGTPEQLQTQLDRIWAELEQVIENSHKDSVSEVN
jgi:dephospho-CoA kinase